MRSALSALAVVVPGWLKEQVTEDWFELYSPRLEEYRLPSAEAEQEQLRVRIGQDGFYLLALAYEQEPNGFPLCNLPTIQVLRQVWLQQYYLCGKEVQ